MQKITANFKGHTRELLLGPAFKFLEAIFELLVPMVMADIIDIGLARGDKPYILVRGLMMLGLGILGFCAAIVCQYFAATSSGAIGRSLRNQAYAQALRLSGAEVAAFETGGLITRLTGDINNVQAGINMAIRLGIRVPFLIVGSIIMALRIDRQIGLIFLGSTPVIILALVLIMRGTLPGYGRVQAMQDALSGQSAENLAGVRVIRAFARQETEKRAYEETSGGLTRVMIRVGRVSALLNPLTSVIANAAIIGIVWLGARRVHGGVMLQGEIIALVNYMTQTLLALIVMANLTVIFTRALASARRVSAVLEITPEIAQKDAALPARDTSAPLLRFEAVQFAYHKGAERALEDISFTLRRGETLGVIGGTGSGKSTIVNLIMRYYDIDSGGIYLDGVDIHAMPPQALRRRVGLAPQKAVLFAGTVRHNLAISAPEATEAEMWQALGTAQCGFVRESPEGLDMPVREGGQNLSGGQRQRLSIARALVRRTDLLILDDASSALDYATDAALRAALRARQQAAQGVILVSQRAASLMQADQILVLDDGRIAATGTHDALLQSSGLYREICRSQGIRTGEEGAQ